VHPEASTDGGVGEDGEEPEPSDLASARSSIMDYEQGVGLWGKAGGISCWGKGGQLGGHAALGAMLSAVLVLNSLKASWSSS